MTVGKLTTMREANRIRAEGGPASRVLLVGELNPYGGPDSNALVPWPAGCAGHRLQSRILGLPEETYLAMHRRNLCRGTWSIRAARDAAWSCITATGGPHPWNLIVLLGRKVADAFVQHYTPRVWGPEPAELRPFTWVWCQGFRLVTLPHPSGRNASSWHADAIERTRVMLRELEPEIPWGSL